MKNRVCLYRVQYSLMKSIVFCLWLKNCTCMENSIRLTTLNSSSWRLFKREFDTPCVASKCELDNDHSKKKMFYLFSIFQNIVWFYIHTEKNIYLKILSKYFIVIFRWMFDLIAVIVNFISSFSILLILWNCEEIVRWW